MAIQLLKSNTKTVGTGKTKGDYTEVLFGWDDVGTADFNTSGNFTSVDFSTGSSLDNPFGLELVEMSCVIDPDVLGSTVRGGAVVFVSDQDLGVAPRIYDLETYHINDIVTVGGSAVTLGLGSGSEMPTVTMQKDLTYGTGQRKIFVGDKVKLHINHYIQSQSGLDKMRIIAKYVFKHVKMTRSAYLEKLATRIC